MARLFLPAVLRPYARGSATIEVAGSTVREALDHLATELPPLERRIRDERGGLRQHIQLFVDATNIRELAEQETAIDRTSEIHVVPAMSGGR